MTGLGTYMCLRQRKRLSGVENRVDTNSALAILSTPMWTRISGETKSTKRWPAWMEVAALAVQ